MTSYCGGKRLKKHTTPDEFEMQIGHTIQDLETNSDWILGAWLLLLPRKLMLETKK